MVTLDPCKRLKTIYHQLVPSIIVNTKGKSGITSKSAVDSTLSDLEERSFSLARSCSRCSDCDLWHEEKIGEFFRETREKLEDIWRALEENSGDIEAPCYTV